MVAALLLVAGLLPGSFDGGESPADPADLSAYKAALAGIGRGPEANVKLALWCEAHGLQAERIKHLALAVLSDPTNATARGLMGLVAYRGQWKRPDAVAEKVKDDEALTARLAEYNARRAKAPESADAQWTLALWCEQNGLDAEARAHFSVVTRLDPSREAAWKRLGCKKVNGRWVTEAQVAAEKDEAEAQKKADRHWKPLLTKWRGWLGDKNKRDEAEKALSEINRPARRAVSLGGTRRRQAVEPRDGGAGAGPDRRGGLVAGPGIPGRLRRFGRGPPRRDRDAQTPRPAGIRRDTHRPASRPDQVRGPAGRRPRFTGHTGDRRKESDPEADLRATRDAQHRGHARRLFCGGRQRSARSGAASPEVPHGN